MTHSFELIREYEITDEVHGEIRELLREAFPGSEFHANRDYAKQVPQERLLLWEDGALIAHSGLLHRVVGTETGPATIFGMIDVCVRASHRGRGIGSEMLEYVSELGRRHGVEFLMLFAADERLYVRNGLERKGNVLRWLKIDEHRNYGIDEQPLRELMVKPLGERVWPEGVVDLLGYQF